LEPYVSGVYKNNPLSQSINISIESQIAKEKYQDYKMSKKPRKDTESQN
jgi:hypothetical protein